MTFRFADAVFWFAVACCTVGHLAILRSIVVTPIASGDPRSERRRRFLEVVWAIVPGVALAVVLVFTWRAIHRTAHPTHDMPASVAIKLQLTAFVCLL
jgi:heme/copper-type cytochrome/quinol oxidase subunit 2